MATATESSHAVGQLSRRASTVSVPGSVEFVALRDNGRAYRWHVLRVPGLGRHRLYFELDGDRSEDGESSGVMAGKRLIDQALATVVAADSLGPRDQISLTREQALVWAIYLRVIECHRGLASADQIKYSVRAAGEGGISADEIEAAIAAADRPEARAEK
jgi:hypothetical protein